MLLGAGALDKGLLGTPAEEAGTEEGTDAGGGVLETATPLLIVPNGAHCEDDGIGCAAGVLGSP